MQPLPAERLEAYRARTFRLEAADRVRTRDEAVHFVRERGFVLFWPVSGIVVPSLWAAVAGDRPVADAHDDPGHVTWGWKDSLLGSREWYYAKVLRRRATMIGMDAVPFFYALSENYGSPEDDHLGLYEQGRLSPEARAVYEAVLREGPMDTVALRRATRLSGRGSEYRFARALTDLQAGFRLLPTGVARVGGWNYAFIYSVVAYHYPELPEEAHAISRPEARRSLVELHLRSVGAARVADLTRLFGWMPEDTERAVSDLTEVGTVRPDVSVADRPGRWVVLGDLL